MGQKRIILMPNLAGRATLRQSYIEMPLTETLTPAPHSSSACAPRRSACLPLLAPAVAALTLLALLPAARAQQVDSVHAPAETPLLLDAMTTELHRAFTSLGKPAAPAFRRCRGRQTAAAVFPQLLGTRRQLRDHPRTVRRADRQRRFRGARGRRAGAPGQPQARQHARRPSRLGGQQHATAARRRPRSAWRARCGWPPTPATATRSTTILRVKTEAAGARQRRRHFAGFQPGSAAGAYRQAGAAGGQSTARHGSSGCARSRRSSANFPMCIRTW